MFFFLLSFALHISSFPFFCVSFLLFSVCVSFLPLSLSFSLVHVLFKKSFVFIFKFCSRHYHFLKECSSSEPDPFAWSCLSVFGNIWTLWCASEEGRKEQRWLSRKGAGMSWSEDRSARLPSSEQHVKEESQWSTKPRAVQGWDTTSWKSNSLIRSNWLPWAVSLFQSDVIDGNVPLVACAPDTFKDDLEGPRGVDGHMCLLPHVASIATEGPDLGVDGSLVPHTN